MGPCQALLTKFRVFGTLVSSISWIRNRSVNVNTEHDNFWSHCAHLISKTKSVNAVQISLEGVLSV